METLNNQDGKNRLTEVQKDIPASGTSAVVPWLEDKEFNFSLIEYAPNPIVVQAPDSSIIYVNPAFEKLTGYSRQEMIGQKAPYPYWCAEKIDEYMEIIQERLTQPVPITRIRMFCKKEGQQFWVQSSLAPVKDLKGNVKYFVSMWLDFTDLRKAEENLLDNSQRYKSLFEHNPDASYSLDFEGRFSSVNKSGCDLFGYTQEEIISISIWHLIEPQELEKAHLFFDLAYSGLRQHYELGILTKNGRHIDISVTNIPIILKGKVTGIYGIAQDITEQNGAKLLALKSEAELKKSEFQYRQVVENINEGILALDKDSYITFTNARAVEMLGYALNELVGKHLFSLLDNAGVTIIKEYFSRLLKGFRGQIENEIIRKNGSRITVLMDISPVLDTHGNFSGSMISILDITEWKKTRSALTESEERFRKIFEESPLGMVITESNFRFAKVNAAFCQMLGYSQEELMLRTFSDITHPDHVDADLKNVKELFKGQITQYHTEKRYICKDGSIIWGSTTVNIIRDIDGSVKHFLTLIENITERKKAEQKLKESEAFSTSVLSNSPNPIVVIDPDTSITYINPAFEKLTGYSPSELIGARSPYPFWLETSISKNLAIIKEKLNNEGTHYSQNSFRTKHGEIFLVDITGTPIIDDRGKVQRYVINWVDITERHKMENDLRDSEEFSSSLLSNAPNPIIVTNPDTSIKYINPAFENLTGFQSVELIGTKIPYPWWPEKILTENGGRNDQFDYEEIHDAERCGRKKDGTPFWISLNRNVVNVNGEIKYYVGNWVDITQRKKAEEQIKYQAMLVNSVSDAVISTDLKLQIVSWNNAAENIHGWKKEEVIGKRIRDVMGLGFDCENHEESLRRLKELIDQVSTRGSWRGELVNLRKDGKTVFESATVSLVVDETGKRIGVVGIFSDITEKKRAEAAVRLNEARLESLFRIIQHKGNSIRELLDLALDEAVKLTRSKIGYLYYFDDEQNKFVLNTWSMGIANVLNISGIKPGLENYDNGPWKEVIHQKTSRIVNDLQINGLSKNVFPKGHLPIDRYMSTPFVINDKFVAALGVANKPTDYDQGDLNQLTLLINSAWEIMERRKAEDELKLAAEGLEILYEKEKNQRQELEEEARARGMFIDVLAHELRSPLTPILACSSMLKDILNSRKDDVPKRLSENIFTGADTMAHRLEELLDLARYSRGNIQLQLQSTDILRFIEEVVSRFQPGIDSRCQTILLDISHELPMVEIDPSRLEQVLINLLSNASKFSPDKSSIFISAQSINEGILIDIKDSGIGISPEEQSRLFEPYHRVEQDRQKFPGIGLGLAVSKKVVEAHGGKIWMTSQLGHGSTFSFVIPVKSTTSA